MKKTTLKLCLLAATVICLENNANAQWGNSTSTSAITDNGIHEISFPTSTSNIRALKGKSAHNWLEIYGNSGVNDGAGLVLGSDYSGSLFDGMIQLTSGGTGTANDNSRDNTALQLLQYNGGSYISHLHVTKDGRFGLGDNAPQANVKLTVNGSMSFTPSSSLIRHIRGNSYYYGLELYAGQNADEGASLLLFGNARSADAGCAEIWSSGWGTGGQAFRLIHREITGNTYTELFGVTKDGQVTIGNVPTVSTNDYKLYVQTGILTEKVKVALSSDATNWSDFVFNDDYELRSLGDVENYIKENKHLPEIPSTEEVHANGLDLAQMDAKLLQKIEELTLYIIQQQKEINELKKKVN